MKVLDLRCASGHAFEGWFASEDDYLSQSERHLVACPMCGDAEVTRLPSAPRLNVSGAREPSPAPAPTGPHAPGAAPVALAFVSPVFPALHRDDLVSAKRFALRLFLALVGGAFIFSWVLYLAFG